VNRHLFADHVRRNRSNFLVAVLATTTFWFVSGWDPLGASIAIATSLGVTIVLGPLLTLQSFGSREILLRPISPRDLWRTRWWVSTILPVGLVATGQVLGLLLARSVWTRPGVSLEIAGLSSMYDFAYAGMFLGLMALVQFPSAPYPPGIPGVLKKARAALAVVALVVMFSLPFVTFRVMPATWLQMTWATAAGLLAAFGLTIVGFLATPNITVAPTPREKRLPESRGRFLAALFANVTGLRRMALKTAGTALFYQSVFIVLIVGGMAIVSPLFDGRHESLAFHLRDMGLLPFETDSASKGLFMLYILGNLGLMWYPMLGGDALISTLRHLRTLPLTTSRLTAAVVGIPMTSWATLLLLLTVIHATVTRQLPAPAALVQFVCLMAIHSVVRALDVKLGWSPSRMFWIGVPASMACGPIIRMGWLGQLSVCALSLFAIGLAASMTKDALMRTSPRGMPTQIRFGFARILTPRPR
jgi:hypothetical protein